MQKPFGQFIRINQRNIHYVNLHAKSKSSDLTFIMFSGAGSDSFDWLPIMNYLSLNANCLVVDKPGFMGTSVSDKEFQQQIIEDVFDISNKLNLRKLFLIGHSSGFLSALLFYSKYEKESNIIGIASLDGIEIDLSAVNLLKKMSPPVWMKYLQKLLILNMGMFRRSMTLKIEEYSEHFNQFLSYYEKFVKKNRIKKKHIKSITDENNLLPDMIEKYLFLKDINLKVPLLDVKAISKDGINGSEEIKYFPQLKELIFEVEEKGILWKETLVSLSKGEKKEITASHFLHGEQPEKISDMIINFKNKCLE